MGQPIFLVHIMAKLGRKGFRVSEGVPFSVVNLPALRSLQVRPVQTSSSVYVVDEYLDREETKVILSFIICKSLMLQHLPIEFQIFWSLTGFRV